MMGLLFRGLTDIQLDTTDFCDGDVVMFVYYSKLILGSDQLLLRAYTKSS